MLSNTGAQSLTFSGASAPRAPFASSGLPASGTKLAPGTSLGFSVSFSPEALGAFTDSISIESTGGNILLPLSGDAQNVGKLVIAPLSLDVGVVAVGSRRTVSFTVSNTGGSEVTITKSKPPITGFFRAKTALDEGTRIPAGETLTEEVEFAPTDVGHSSDVWIINDDAPDGLRSVTFTGTAIEPSSGAGDSGGGGSGGVDSLPSDDDAGHAGAAGFGDGTSHSRGGSGGAEQVAGAGSSARGRASSGQGGTRGSGDSGEAGITDGGFGAVPHGNGSRSGEEGCGCEVAGPGTTATGTAPILAGLLALSSLRRRLGARARRAASRC
jgi:hypothetical protein